MAAARGRVGGVRTGAGRKPIPPEDRRRNRIMVSLTDAEHEDLLGAAEGEPAGTFVHRLIVRHLARRRK